jgi:hypothetical protein
MPITPEPFPEDAKAAFLRALGDQPVGLPLYSVPVYSLGLRGLAREEGLSGARKIGWYFLTTQGPDAVSGDVPDQPMATEAPTASRARGPTIAAALNAYGGLAALEQVAQTQFAPRLLRIPGLLIEAYWLKAASDRLDCVVPFLTYAPELRVQVALPRAEFEGIVQGLAKRQLALRNPPP